jgi:DNA-binding YbaB/EbfC family protein
MKGFPGGMQQFLKQANQLQSRMKKLQDELKTREYSATSGGGAVSVTVNGSTQLTTLMIKEDVFKSGDAEMLQDLVLTATNEALRTAKTESDKEMEKLTGGMSVPGLF